MNANPERSWFYIDGEPLDREDASKFESDLRGSDVKVIGRSRGEYKCVLGCAIPAGSRYAKLQMVTLHFGGNSHHTLALCAKHLDDVAAAGEKDWLGTAGSAAVLERVREIELTDD